MASSNSYDLVDRARAIYVARLKTKLESTNQDDFVAIEPDSGDFYLGKSLSEAVQAARLAHPQSLSFVMRVGHAATVELGVIQS